MGFLGVYGVIWGYMRVYKRAIGIIERGHMGLFGSWIYSS